MAGDGPEWTLTYDPSAPAPSIARIDLTRTAPHERASAIETAAVTAQAGLHLERGPLLAAVHYDLGEGPGRLLLVIHHLAVDGVSWRVLIEDLELAYLALQAGAPVELPTPSASFGRWSQALTDYASTAEPGNSLADWRNIDAVDGTLPTVRLGARREHGGHGADGDGVPGSRRDPSPAPAGSGGVPHADQRRPSRRPGAGAPRLDGP